MEESGETECSRTSQSEGNDDDKECREASNKGSCSRDEEKEKMPPIRPYVRSKTPRLRWTPDLHLRFLQSVKKLGGLDRATPKLVLQLMNIRGLNITHVKSHLQMYRSKQIDEHNYQGTPDNGLFLGGAQHQILFNRRHLPLLPSFHQRHLSNYSQNYRSPINLDFCSRRKEEDLKENFGLLHSPENPKRVQSRQSNSSFDRVYFTSSNLVQHRVDDQRSLSGFSRSNHPSLDRASHFQREMIGIKRKATNFELDLNLSLGLESRNDVQQNSISSSNTVLLYKKLEEDFGTTRDASTLDLTL